MLDPHELYELTDELHELGQPVLIQALTGFVDAGSAARLAREQLLTSLQAQPIARFDVDQLFDYRSRRPVMTFVEDHWADYDAPALELHLLRDDDETPFLLLTGPEPDLQWERFVAAVAALCARLRPHVDHVTLNVKADNTAAVRLYERLGFTRVADFGEHPLTAFDRARKSAMSSHHAGSTTRP